jgi:hypothetical protein
MNESGFGMKDRKDSHAYPMLGNRSFRRGKTAIRRNPERRAEIKMSAEMVVKVRIAKAVTEVGGPGGGGENRVGLFNSCGCALETVYPTKSILGRWTSRMNRGLDKVREYPWDK